MYYTLNGAVIPDLEKLLASQDFEDPEAPEHIRQLRPGGSYTLVEAGLTGGTFKCHPGEKPHREGQADALLRQHAAAQREEPLRRVHEARVPAEDIPGGAYRRRGGEPTFESLAASFELMAREAGAARGVAVEGGSYERAQFNYGRQTAFLEAARVLRGES